MTTITIKNIGPIKEIINLNLNKVNVFMGPQSSGKSTIAAIISFCTWIEKEIATNQSVVEYNTNGNFKKKLEEFHRLNGYFKENSEIYYESSVIKLQFRNNKCSIEWKDKYAYKRSKIEYIPSERNLIVLPLIQKVDMANNNIRSFLFDWLTAAPKYTKESKIKILDLPVEYYFDESTGESHIISTESTDKYDVLLENASSGVQSLTPLVIVLKYLTEWIYENEEDVSFEKRQRQGRILNDLVDELILYKHYGQKYSEEERDKKIGDFNNLLEQKNTEALAVFRNWGGIMDGILKAQNTQFIIEEPEQNLFPSTQKDLIYHLLDSFNFDRGDKLTITTHSPYVLYALNNCMLGHLVKGKMMNDEDYVNLKSLKSSINPKDVSVWQITDNGTIDGIQGADRLIEGNYFDNCMKDVMDDFYKMINYYGDEDEN